MRIFRLYIAPLLGISTAMRTLDGASLVRQTGDARDDIVWNPRKKGRRNKNGPGDRRHDAKGRAGHGAQSFPLVSMDDILRHDRNLGEMEFFMSSFPEWIDKVRNTFFKKLTVMRDLVRDLHTDSLIEKMKTRYETMCGQCSLTGARCSSICNNKAYSLITTIHLKHLACEPENSKVSMTGGSLQEVVTLMEQDGKVFSSTSVSNQSWTPVTQLLLNESSTGSIEVDVGTDALAKLMDLCQRGNIQDGLIVELWRPSAKWHALGTCEQDLQHLERLRTKVMKPMREHHSKMLTTMKFLRRSRYALDPDSARTLEVDLDFVRKQAILQLSVIDESVDNDIDVLREAALSTWGIYTSLIGIVSTSDTFGTVDRRKRSKLTLASRVVRALYQSMNTLRITALIRPMALQAALTRTLRLLTVGARSSVDDAGWKLQLNESNIKVNYTLEEDYEFLHDFVRSYPASNNFWNQRAVHARMLAASKTVVDTFHVILPSFRAHPQGVATYDAGIRKNLASLKTTLQSTGAFGFPVLLEHIDSEEDQDKIEWARRWAWIRAAAEFYVWPASAESQAVVAPKICEAPFYNDDEMARFPRVGLGPRLALGIGLGTVAGLVLGRGLGLGLGIGLALGLAVGLAAGLGLAWAPGFDGQPVMHSFMVFAGNETSIQEGCVQVLQKLRQSFPLSHDAFNREYQQIRKKAASAGCLGFQRVSKTISEMQEHLSDALSRVGEIEFDIELASGTKFISVRSARPQRIPGNVRRKRSREGNLEGVADEIVKYVMHGIMKYSTKIGDDNITSALRRSLAKSPPKVSAMTLSEHHWKELEDQGVTSPYQASRCQEVDGVIECDPWNHTVPGYWSEAKVAGDTLAVVLVAVDSAISASKSGDWARLAQGPALYGAVGFDSPGVVDNSHWKCETKTHSCRVHPTCGRIAAQMLEHPFMGNKGYASEWPDKIQVYKDTQESGFFSLFHNYKFHSDGSGFHDWCHRPGKAYCWSYTICLQKMMNFLCSNPWTSQYCCPTPDTREACQRDVNGEECKVCRATSVKDEDDMFPPQPFEDENETMKVLRMDDGCKLCLRLADAHYESLWLFVKETAMCKYGNLARCAKLCGFMVESPDDFDVCRVTSDKCEGCLF